MNHPLSIKRAANLLFLRNTQKWNSNSGIFLYYKNRRPDGHEEVTVEDLKEERDEDILQHYEHLANYGEHSETGKTGSSSGNYFIKKKSAL